MLMGFVAVLALGLAAMKVASEGMMKASMTIGLVILLVGTLGAAVRRSGVWIGFALFGWTYALVAFVTPVNEALEARFPASDLMNNLADRMHPKPAGIGDPPAFDSARDYMNDDRRIHWVTSQIYCAEIGHVIAASIFAYLGAIAGHFLDDRSKRTGKTPDGRMPATSG
jgi:hypothetical protein